MALRRTFLGSAGASVLATFHPGGLDRVFADAVWPGQIAQDGLIEEGFRRAESTFTWDRITEDLLAEYERLFTPAAVPV